MAPYPPGVNQMLKKRKALKIQGEIYLKVGEYMYNSNIVSIVQVVLGIV